MKIRIGTRKSRLAMIQTEIVKKAIEKSYGKNVKIEIVPVVTQGDRILNKSLTSFGGKGVFTKELEEQLLSGAIDMAVHSAKDMPMEFPPGLAIGAVLEREDPRDVLVTVNNVLAEDMAAGSVIGTSSLRRELQIKHINPQLEIKLLRGNVETRLEKLKNGGYDGIILAAAGLKRLGITAREGFFFQYLEPETFVPAAGQGILTIETRDGELKEILAAIHSPETEKILKAEREFLAILGGGCNAPCGAFCRKTKEGFHMNAMYASDGKSPLFMEEEEKEAEGLAEKLARKLTVGKVVLAGAGPGDMGLISRKAWEAVKQADVIVYDSLISPSILNAARLDAQLIYAGKRMGNHSMRQEEINGLLGDLAEQGKFVLRLKGGDPYIFGRGGEEAMELAGRGIPFEIIPGVSSSYGAAAYAGIPVTDRNLASSFHVVTGRQGNHKEGPGLDYKTLAREEGTLVFLMGVSGLKNIAQGLIRWGKDGKTPAAVIEKGTTREQRTVTAPLEEIWKKAEDEKIGTPAAVVIGEVVGLRENLKWFEKGPLFGRRILLTGTRQMARKLEKVLLPLGGDVVSLSLIEAEGIVSQQASVCLSHLERYTWLVFTSSNGVLEFFRQLKELNVDFRRLGQVKFAVIGKGTEETLRDFGFQADFLPSVYSSAALAQEWVPALSEKDRVLFVKAEESSRELPEKMDEAGIKWDGAALYRTAVDMRREDELKRLTGDMDYIVLTSGSGARALASMWRPEDFRGKIVSIGPVTSKEAEKAGIHVHITASVYTAEGIGAAILRDGKQPGKED